MKVLLIILLAFFISAPTGCYSQLKFLIEDFEGCSRSPESMNRIGAFTFGSLKLKISQSQSSGKGYSGRTAIEQLHDGTHIYGGWGLGVFRLIQLNQEKDRFNFFFLSREATDASMIIYLQDDDNWDGVFTEHSDDVWKYHATIKPGKGWQYFSIPLSALFDDNKGGDGAFNINYKEGKLLSVMFRNTGRSTPNVLYDFFCFSEGHLSDPATFSEARLNVQNAGCAIGAWSEEGQRSGLGDIVRGFTKGATGTGSVSLVHSFHPFSDDGSTRANKFPDARELQRVVDGGLVPMITIENQFLGLKDKKQPSLKDVAEGRYDHYFSECGKRFSQVKGKVMVRLMHEFNGNWYPWCIANNNNSPELYKAAWRRIVTKFREAGAHNVLFVWCPNSGSLPQKPWNYIIDAYPGDDVVDIVGTDVYNGAEKGNMIWRSFRKEASETYWLLTSHFPDKPFMICEMASRERHKSDGKDAPGKEDWIYEASEALKTDFSKCFVFTWFNSGKYKINTSDNSRNAFINYMWSDPYFKDKSLKLDNLR